MNVVQTSRSPGTVHPEAMPSSHLSVLFALTLLAGSGSASATGTDEVDLENGADINETCAGCHGEFGQGGKQGEYPRLAGMPAAFIAHQLHLFRDRKRPNLAMIEYVDERQMPDEDIRDISAYLERMEVPRRMPDMPADATALARLQAAARVLNIPRAEGDAEAGRRLYNRECGSCHGADGLGDREQAVPPLVGQYTNYLQRQVEKYLKRIRIHDESDPDYELLADFTADELRDIFAYLSVADNQ